MGESGLRTDIAEGESNCSDLIRRDLTLQFSDEVLNGVAGHQSREEKVHRDRDPRRQGVQTEATQDHSHAQPTPVLKGSTSATPMRDSLSSAQPQLPRTTSSVGKTMVRFTSLESSSMATSASTATSPRMLPD